MFSHVEEELDPEVFHQFVADEYQNYQMLLAQGKAAYENNDLDLALGNFFEILQIYTKDTEVLDYCGKIYKRYADEAQAKNNPDNSLAEEYLKQNAFYFESSKTFTEYNNTLISNHRAACQHLFSLHQLNNHTDFSEYEPLVEAYTGHLYSNAKAYALSIHYLTKALEINPEDFISRTHRGIAYLALNQFTLGYKDCDEALKHSNYSLAYRYRGILHFEENRIEESLHDLENYMKYEPEDLVDSLMSNDIYRNRIIQILNHQTPTDVEIPPNIKELSKPYNEQCQKLIRKGKVLEALNMINEGIKLHVLSPFLHADRGFIYYYLKKYNESLKDYSIAIWLSEKSQCFEYYEQRRRINLHCGNPNAASVDHSNAIEIQPDQEMALDIRFAQECHEQGLEHVSNEQYERALIYFNMAMNYNRRSADVLYDIASAYYKLNQLEEAKIALTNSLIIYPTQQRAINLLKRINLATALIPTTINNLSEEKKKDKKITKRLNTFVARKKQQPNAIIIPDKTSAAEKEALQKILEEEREAEEAQIKAKNERIQERKLKEKIKAKQARLEKLKERKKQNTNAESETPLVTLSIFASENKPVTRDATLKETGLKIILPETVKNHLAKLKNEGETSYIDGGYLRDVLLQNSHAIRKNADGTYTSTELLIDREHKIHDIDVVTTMAESDLETLYRDMNLEKNKFVKGLYHLKLEDGMRIDFYCSEKLKTSLKFDASARDGTCDAIYSSVEDHQIYDPTGLGIDDILARKFNPMSQEADSFVLSPSKSFVSDPIRMLRAIYIATKCGFSLNEATLKHLKTKNFLLSSVEPGKINVWLKKCLLHKNAEVNYKKMVELGIMQTLFPTLMPALKKEEEKILTSLRETDKCKYPSLAKIYRNFSLITAIDNQIPEQVIINKNPLLANELAPRQPYTPALKTC